MDKYYIFQLIKLKGILNSLITDGIYLIRLKYWE